MKRGQQQAEVETLTRPRPGCDEKGSERGDGEVRVYRRRWLVLGLFILYSTTINGQWTEYSIISNVITRYYNASSFAVDCTTTANMWSYVVLVFPAAYYSERVGVRWTLILGCCLSCLGAWIKAFAVQPHQFHWVLLGQTLVSCCQVLMLPMPGRVAAKWFGAGELSMATSIGIFGIQLGVAVSFLLPPIFIRWHDDPLDVESDLGRYHLAFAAATTVALLLVCLLFEEEPESPPSETRALQKAQRSANDSSCSGRAAAAAAGFLGPLRRLARNRSYLLLCNSYGLGVGVLNVISTLLNPIYLAHFENGEEDAGRVGLLIIIPGMLGSVSFGVVLDRTHKFKQTAVMVYALSLLGQLLFTSAILLENKWIVYFAATFLGVFLSGYLALGYELATEFTYPENEQLTAGVMNIVNNVYGGLLVIGLSYAMGSLGDVYVHAGLALALLLGLLLTLATPDEQRRQDAYESAKAGGCAYRPVAAP